MFATTIIYTENVEELNGAKQVKRRQFCNLFFQCVWAKWSSAWQQLQSDGKAVFNF